MTKYPHGLTLNAVCAAIEDYQRHEDSVPEEGILAAFNTLLGHSDIAEALRSMERTADANMAAAQAMRDDMYHWKQRAEAAEAKLAQREKLDEEAMHCATILEFIGSFESDDIDGDLVDLRFEIDGEDTGSDVSITEYALRSAKAIRAIISGASVLRPAPAINLAELVPDEKTEGQFEIHRWAEKAMDIREIKGWTIAAPPSCATLRRRNETASTF